VQELSAAPTLDDSNATANRATLLCNSESYSSISERIEFTKNEHFRKLNDTANFCPYNP